MPFTKSFGKGALEALRGLVTSFKGSAKGNKGASKGFRVSGAGARWGLGGRNRPRKTEPNFVVLIFIKYTGWVRESQENMQLNSVENDLVEVLKYLGYGHGDTNTTWRLLIDFDLKYTDDAGQTKVLKGINPTRAAILNAIKESGKTGRSGLVYFGGHGEYATRGTSVLKPIKGGTQYTVAAPVDTQEGTSETKSSFLLAIDGGRIYGEDIISCLPEEVSGECIHTVAIDACHSAGVASAARNLLHVYDGKKPPKDKGAEKSPETANAGQRTSKQLVIISAAREGELARTVRPNSMSSSEFGRLTWYMLHWLTKHPHAEAQNLSERLEHVCVDMAKKQGRPEQHPAILARHPLEGPFEILPGLYHQDQDESSVMEYPERAIPIIPWFRPPHLSSGSWTGYRIPRPRAAAH